jgi:ribA/ribD-fused uncharacterized protein
VMKIISKFSGQYRFLSNFWPCVIIWEGDEYPSTEHAYVAAKSEDKSFRFLVKCARTPGDAKRLGRAVTLRSGWDSIKFDIMRDLLALKFNDGGQLTRKLVETKEAILIEGNTWHDNIWGSCLCTRKSCNNTGENNLGLLLMKRRDELK